MPDQLELVVSGHINNVETAEAFMSPPLQLPCLKSCSIRLDPYKNGHMQTMIKQTIVKVTGEQPVGYCFAKSFDLASGNSTANLILHGHYCPSSMQWDYKKRCSFQQYVYG